MSIAERYLKAAQSSHLELRPEPCDVDVLIAAGWVREGLGTALLRLRGEFDAVKRRPGNRPADRTLMLMLKSFSGTRAAILSYAFGAADRRGIPLTPTEVADTAAIALEAFLDPLCVPCDGLGFTKGAAGYRGPSFRCTACRETGRRPIPWRTEAQEQFGRWLGGEMDSKVDNVLRQMSRYTR